MTTKNQKFVPYQAPDEPKGISFGIDSYFNAPTVRFGTGNHKCSLTAPKVKRILIAIKDNGVDAVVDAMKELVSMSDAEWVEKQFGAQPKKAKKPTKKAEPKPILGKELASMVDGNPCSEEAITEEVDAEDDEANQPIPGSD